MPATRTPDTYKDRISAHIKLDTPDWRALRRLAEDHCLTVQDVIEGYVRALLDGNSSAKVVMELTVKRFMKAQLDNAIANVKVSRRTKRTGLHVAPSETNLDALYSLIEDGKKGE